MSIPRVAFFADSFHEVNGVARTSREFARYAEERHYPFFSVHAGPETRHMKQDQFETYELKSSKASVRLEMDLSFDLLFLRHWRDLAESLRRFRPDVIHVTGPSHIGLLGAILAHRLKVPLSASWHTNIHEYAGRRLANLVRWLPKRFSDAVERLLEGVALFLTLVIYRLADVLFAPNPELIALLTAKTGKRTHAMHRGIDTDLFSPARRKRSDDDFVIGYVGRLSAEKNVRMLGELEEVLQSRGVRDCRFLIVGHGDERDWLAENLKRRELPGVLRGEALAAAYANMDAFVFPSATDTFGNVVLEALASGVPPIVSDGGGPKFLIEQGRTGYVAGDATQCADAILLLKNNQDLLRMMRADARQAASACSWPAVFDGVYWVYEEALASGFLAGSRRRRAALPLISRAG